MTQDGPSVTVVLPQLYPAQHDAIYAPVRYVVIEASTKAGKTLGCLVWQMGRALSDRGNHWWVAPVYAQARMAWERAKAMLPAATVIGTNRTELTITLTNGSVWHFRSGEKPDNLYGEDVKSCVIDEASRCRPEVWYAVRSTLTATGGPVRVIGNVRGRGTWHYMLARRAESGEPDHHYAKLTAYDAVEGGVVSREEVEDARRQLPDHVFRELYLAEASDDGANPFGLEALTQCAQPMPDTEPMVWGFDVARVTDWTVGVGIDREGQVCRVERWRSSWADTVDRIVALCGKTPGYVDATGVGDVIAETLRQRRTALEPFVFSASSKQRIMERLSLGIQQGPLRIPDSGPLRAEMETMEYAVTRTGVRYEAPSGLHDDAVCALALAWEYGCDRMGLHLRRASIDGTRQAALGYARRSTDRRAPRGIGASRRV